MFKSLLVLMPEEIQLDPVLDNFKNVGVYPVGCTYDAVAIGVIQWRFESILLILPDDFDNEARKVCLYLRDMSIDEEKRVFICGKRSVLAQAVKLLPAMIRSGSILVDGGTGYTTLRTVASAIKNAFLNDKNQKSCLILDDDKQYDSDLLKVLSRYCNVAIKDKVDEEFAAYVTNADILLISTELKMDLLEFTTFRQQLAARKKTGRTSLIYLCADDARQQLVYQSMNAEGVSLSKDRDFLSTSRCIIRWYIENNS